MIDNNSIYTKISNVARVLGVSGGEYPSTDLVARVETLSDHAHSKALVYPGLADPVTVTAAAGLWTFGSYAEIVPVSTITDYFDFHYVIVGNISDNGDYVFDIASGLAGAEVLIGQIAFIRTTNQVRVGYTPIQTAIQTANTRISGRLASNVGGAATAAIKLMYHTY